jgi:hypothetical protein
LTCNLQPVQADGWPVNLSAQNEHVMNQTPRMEHLYPSISTAAVAKSKELRRVSFNANDIMLDAAPAEGDKPAGGVQMAGEKECCVSNVDCAPASFADASVGTLALHCLHDCDA